MTGSPAGGSETDPVVMHQVGTLQECFDAIGRNIPLYEPRDFKTVKEFEAYAQTFVPSLSVDGPNNAKDKKHFVIKTDSDKFLWGKTEW